MRLFHRKLSRKELTIEDFKEDRQTSEVTITISPKLLERLQKDGYGKDAKVGTSTSTVESSTFKARCKIWSSQVTISFDGDEVSNKEMFISIINNLLEWIELNKKEIESVIIDDLLELKNEIWLDENEKKYSKGRFIRKIKPEEVYFYSDNSFKIFFNDNMLFAGHDITVSIDPKMKIEEASI